MTANLDTQALRLAVARREASKRVVCDKGLHLRVEDPWGATASAWSEIHRAELEIAEAAPALLDAAEENAKLRAENCKLFGEGIDLASANDDYDREIRRIRAQYKAINDAVPEGFFHAATTPSAPTLADAVRNVVTGHANLCAALMSAEAERDALRAEVATLKANAQNAARLAHEDRAKLSASGSEIERLREALISMLNEARRVAFVGTGWMQTGPLIDRIDAALRPMQSEVKP